MGKRNREVSPVSWLISSEHLVASAGRQSIKAEASACHAIVHPLVALDAQPVHWLWPLKG